jgi:hypothetical protein
MREGAVQRDAGKADVAGRRCSRCSTTSTARSRPPRALRGRDLAKGVELVAAKLVRRAAALGLERIDATGSPFDPNVHEAVQQARRRTDDEPTVVAEVLRPGYRLGDRVLRPRWSSSSSEPDGRPRRRTTTNEEEVTADGTAA